VAGGAPRQDGAATGFALALAARLMATDPGLLLWVQQEISLREAGAPYGPGLHMFGIDPERLLIVRSGNARDTLWAAEEGLSCRALALVLAESWDGRALSLTASRRLRLAAQASGVPALLLSGRNADTPSAASTRWRVAARPGAGLSVSVHDLGRPRWKIALEKNRSGRLGAWTVEWKSDAYRFLLSSARSGPTHSGIVAAAAFDRSDRAGAALRRAG
jgi:protein ImuA